MVVTCAAIELGGWGQTATVLNLHKRFVSGSTWFRQSNQQSHYSSYLLYDPETSSGKQTFLLQSVAYKEQKNSIFPSDIPSSNAMYIGSIFTTYRKVIISLSSVFIYCKQLQQTEHCLLYAKNQILKLM